MSIRPSETRKVMTRANALASAPNSTVLRTPPLPDTRLTPSHHLVVTLTESSKLDSLSVFVVRWWVSIDTESRVYSLRSSGEPNLPKFSLEIGKQVREKRQRHLVTKPTLR